MKAVLISGSIRKSSYNSAIIKYINEYLNSLDHVEALIFNDIDKLPFFSPDKDKHSLTSDQSPQEVVKLREILRSADFVIISTPEYAFEISGVLKNTLDWLVSSGELVDKPAAVISASTSEMGGKSAAEVLTKLLNILSAKVFEEEILNIGRVNKKIDNNGTLDKELQKVLVDFVKKFLTLTFKV